MREERRILMTEKELNGVRFNWTETLDSLCSNGFSQFLDNRTGDEFEIWLNGGGREVLKIPFCDKSCDYCEIEAENYQKAVKEGVEEPFAECYFLMEYESTPCYI